MTTKNDYKTNHLTPPGRILAEELKARGLSRDAFAETTGIPKKELVALLRGTGELTPETAAAIGTCLGTGPEIWVNLERRYQAQRIRLSNRDE